jgi:hypothetical protein
VCLEEASLRVYVELVHLGFKLRIFVVVHLANLRKNVRQRVKVECEIFGLMSASSVLIRTVSSRARRYAVSSTFSPPAP